MPRASSSRRPSESTGFGHSAAGQLIAACVTGGPAPSGAVRELCCRRSCRAGRGCGASAEPPRGESDCRTRRPPSSTGRRRVRAGSRHGRAVCAPARRCRGRSSGRSPARTPASFHARFIASRSPAPMPCPMNGGVRWAASPSRKTLPRRQRSAIWARKVYSVTRTSSSSSSRRASRPWCDQRAQARQVSNSRRRSRRAAAETPSGSGIRRSACRCPRDAGRRPGARPPTGRARRRWRRRRPASAARTSGPACSEPIAARTTLLAPSQPST